MKKQRNKLRSKAGFAVGAANPGRGVEPVGDPSDSIVAQSGIDEIIEDLAREILLLTREFDRLWGSMQSQLTDSPNEVTS